MMIILFPLFLFNGVEASEILGIENYSLLKKWGSKCDIRINSSSCIDPDGRGPLSIGDSQFNFPLSLAVDHSDNTVYVADASNNRIQKFDNNGTFIMKWGSSCAIKQKMGCVDLDGEGGPLSVGDGQFNGPRGIAIDSDGHIYVTDFDNNRIQKFIIEEPCSEGYEVIHGVCFITKWGSMGSLNGQFRVPYDIAIDSHEFLYVTDLLNYRIQKFDNNGTFLSSWKLNGTIIGNKAPHGIGTDPIKDTIYVTTSDEIQKFDNNGTFLSSWKLNATSDFGPTSLQGVTIDSKERVYVTNINDARIQKFDNNGTFIGSWKLNGTDKIGHSGSSDIALDTNNNIYVSDTKNNNVQKFALK